jgi:hypothetical protein
MVSPLSQVIGCPLKVKVVVFLLSRSRIGCPVILCMAGFFEIRGLKIKKTSGLFNDFYQDNDT